jgi:hypothetical protein
VKPWAQLFSVPIGDGVIVDCSIGWLVCTGPENAIGVVPVMRRLKLEPCTCSHSPFAFWRTSTTVTPCPASALATFSSPAASGVMSRPWAAV